MVFYFFPVVYMQVSFSFGLFLIHLISGISVCNVGHRNPRVIKAIHNQLEAYMHIMVYGELVEFMSSGPIVAAVLEKNNAVEDFRTLIGATNPAEAAEGTIRKMFARSIGENAVHGSDSDENALIEAQFHFSGREIF